MEIVTTEKVELSIFIMYKTGKLKLIYYLSLCFVFEFYLKLLYSKQTTTTCPEQSCCHFEMV